MFSDPGNNDYSLQAASPCIGTGRYGGDRGAIPFTTGLHGNPETPAAFRLRGNYPNPFNASTTINYSLPQPSDVRLDIYDILGRKVQTLWDGRQTAGEHSVIWDADGFASGAYFYKITAGEFERSEKMILLK